MADRSPKPAKVIGHTEMRCCYFAVCKPCVTHVALITAIRHYEEPGTCMYHTICSPLMSYLITYSVARLGSKLILCVWLEPWEECSASTTHFIALPQLTIHSVEKPNGCYISSTIINTRQIKLNLSRNRRDIEKK